MEQIDIKSATCPPYYNGRLHLAGMTLRKYYFAIKYLRGEL